MTGASFEFITSDNGTFIILKWNSKCRASQRAHDRSLIRGVLGTHAASGLGSSLIPRYCVKVILFIEYYAQFCPIPVPFSALQWFTIKLYLPTVGIRVSLFHHILGYMSWWNVFRLVLLTTAISKTGWFPSYKWLGPDWGRFFNCMRGWGRWKLVREQPLSNCVTSSLSFGI